MQKVFPFWRKNLRQTTSVIYRDRKYSVRKIGGTEKKPWKAAAQTSAAMSGAADPLRHSKMFVTDPASMRGSGASPICVALSRLQQRSSWMHETLLRAVYSAFFVCFFFKQTFTFPLRRSHRMNVGGKQWQMLCNVLDAHAPCVGPFVPL